MMAIAAAGSWRVLREARFISNLNATPRCMRRQLQ
jgi:hypothetical protein